MKTQRVKVRFAPSPTGPLHLGGARTALFNFLFARQNQGEFILRLDDTDAARSRVEFADDIINSLEWLGLRTDGFYRQSERAPIYQKYLERLIATKQAYWSEETATGQSDRVIRFRQPRQPVVFNDLIRGRIEMATEELGDFIIAKDLTSPLYHFASVTDDYETGITHVIRGEDHLANTPRQILLLTAIGGQLPQYVHLPLILAANHSKLSKRHGEAAISDYRKMGYLPEALVNFLATLGWSPQAQGLEQEIFSLAELVSHFDLPAIQRSGATFSLEKLNWFNRAHLKRLDRDELWRRLQAFLPRALTKLPAYRPEKIQAVLPAISQRLNKLSDLEELVRAGELIYFFQKPKIDKALLGSTEHLAAIADKLKTIPDNQFDQDGVRGALWDYATAGGRHQVLWPMRVALTGRKQSLDPFTVAANLGKLETIKRLEYASKI